MKINNTYIKHLIHIIYDLSSFYYKNSMKNYLYDTYK